LCEHLVGFRLPALLSQEEEPECRPRFRELARAFDGPPVKILGVTEPALVIGDLGQAKGCLGDLVSRVDYSWGKRTFLSDLDKDTTVLAAWS
jgi:hypothetical protein